MNIIATGTALAAVAVLTAAVPSAAASSPSMGQGGGCVSNAAYARLALGQHLSYIRSTAGDAAQTSMRQWSVGSQQYQERLYAMCTPWDARHATLTTRFMYHQGAFRAIVVDTLVGPE